MTLGLATSACSGPCAAGRFGASDGQTSDQCDGPCLDGYWCGPGATTPTAEPCGSNAVICVSPWTGPQAVQTGWYSTGTTAATVSDATRACRERFLTSPRFRLSASPPAAASVLEKHRVREAAPVRTVSRRHAPLDATGRLRRSPTLSAPARATQAWSARLAARRRMWMIRSQGQRSRYVGRPRCSAVKAALLRGL